MTTGSGRAFSLQLMDGPLHLRDWKRLLPVLAGVVVFRLACYAVMTGLALLNELRPAPTLPDLIVSRLPFLPWVNQVNYLAWLLLYLPLSLALLVIAPGRWVRYMVTGGLVSLARGVCIVLTGMGAPDPVHAGAGLGGKGVLSAYLDLISPLGVFRDGAACAYLTKDLFFSGHAATTFLLVLYLWSWPRLRLAALAAHGIMVATVLFAHLHYSIDIVGAWAITFAFFALREWQPREAIQHPGKVERGVKSA